jgi:hypothetical protein
MINIVQIQIKTPELRISYPLKIYNTFLPLKNEVSAPDWF